MKKIKYEVGKPLVKGVTRYPESSKFDFTQAGPVLIQFYYKPTKEEVESIVNGKFQIGFTSRTGEVVFILSKFDDWPWSDAPYSVHLSKPFTFQEMTETQGFGLHIILVDAATGIVKAMRMVGLPHRFSKKLQKAIEEQKKTPFNEVAYDAKLGILYRRYTTEDLVEMADAIHVIHPC